MAQGAASPDDIMKPTGMKALLRSVKQDGDKEISVVVCLSKAKEAVILLDRRMKPRKLLGQLVKEAKDVGLAIDVSTARFGRASLDETDETVLLMKVNKQPAGTALPAQVKKRIKPAGFSEVIFSVDEALEAEGDEDGPAATAEAPFPGALSAGTSPESLGKELAALIRRIPQVAGADAEVKAKLAKLATAANAALKTNQLDEAARLLTELRDALNGNGRNGAAEGDGSGRPTAEILAIPDAGALRQELAALVGRISAADPARKAELAQLAMKGNAALKGGDLAACVATVDQLRTVLDQGELGGPKPAGAWGSAANAWRDANDAVNDQINGLRKAMLDRANSGEDDMDEYAEALTRIAENGLNAMMENQRVKLMAAVMAVGDGADALIVKNGPTALRLIEALTKFLDESEQVAVCDANPFGAPVSIKAILTPPLYQMATALRAALQP